MSDESKTPKQLNIDCKVNDAFSGSLLSKSGKVIHCQHMGYVPSWMPGGGGDYVSLNIDVTTGQILNWKTPTPEAIQEWIEEDS